MSGVLDHLRGHGERVAVLTDTQQLSYHQLADTVAATAEELGGPRRLVLLETRNDVATLVRYLAAMASGHVVLPVDAQRDHTAIVQTYEPDVVIDGNGMRYDILRLHLGNDAWFTLLAYWFFAVGWAAAKASTTLQRAAVTLVLIIGLHGYFDRTERELLVLAGFALLIWLPALRCPPAATVVAGIMAEASLYIYLTHYQVYPLFGGRPLLGVGASVAVGVLLTYLVTVLRKRIRVRLGPLSSTTVPSLR